MFSRRDFCLMVGASVPAACAPQDTSKPLSTNKTAAAARGPQPAGGAYLGPIDEILKTFEWRRTPIPAGGYVIGLDFSSDGARMIHWADVFNGYIRNAGDHAWQLLLRRDTLEKNEYDPRPKTMSTDSGIYAARIAPSNRDVIYLSWNGFIFRSNDGGKSFKRTALPAKLMQSNLGSQHRFNRALDVHPEDANRVLVGTNNDGVYYTIDGGSSWGSITVPSAAPTDNSASRYLVAFAPNDVCYVHVPGSGLYRSTAGPQGQFLNVGGPLTASCLVLSTKGIVYICEHRGPEQKTLKRFDGRNWAGLPCPADQIAVDPRNENHLFGVGENLIGDYPVIRRSIDGGKTWTWHKFTRGSGEVAWLSNRDKASFPAHLLFDPVVPGKLWMADGVGVTWSMVPEPDEVWTLHDYSNGNAELIGNYTVSIPNNPPILTFWDKPFWRLEDERAATNMWSYPVPKGEWFVQDTVTVGYTVDYAADDPSFLVGVAGQGSNRNGFSTDAGKTWTEFANKPASPFAFGGTVAVSTTKNFVILSSNNGSGAYTLDGGMSWQPISFGGFDPVLNWINAYYVNRLNLSADKTRPGVFAALVNNMSPTVPNQVGSPISGLWLSRDGGRTWEHRFHGLIGGAWGTLAQFWQCRLRYVPGYSGELLYADGDGNPFNQLLWSQDDGASWSDVSSDIRNVSSFGFGKAAPGQGRPSVFFDGMVDGVKGIYASFDWFASAPTLLSIAPLDTITYVTDVTGDLNIFGRCYAMLSGNGSAIFRDVGAKAPGAAVYIPPAT